MSAHSAWRLDVARRAAAVYAGNPKVAVGSARRFIERVTVDGDPATLAQVRVAAIREAAALAGHELLAGWKQQAAAYPAVLRQRVAERYLHPDRLQGWHLRTRLRSAATCSPSTSCSCRRSAV